MYLGSGPRSVHIYNSNLCDRRTRLVWSTHKKKAYGLTGGFLLLQNFSVAISVSPHVCFYLSFNFDFYVSKIMHL